MEGATTRAPGTAALVSDPDTIRFTTTDGGFRGRWRPQRSGRYRWVLEDRSGRPAGLTPPPLDITVVPDRPPRVDLVYPGADTVLPASLRQALTADARDDRGIATAELVSWRISALGDRDPERVDTVALDGVRERVLLDAVLDATERRLLPGDTLRYLVRVTDNAPAGQTAESRTYALRLPGVAELRDRTVREAEALTGAAEWATESARALEQAARDLSRSSARRRGAGERGATGMGFDEVQQARQVLERQEAVLEQVQALRDRTEALQRAIEDAGLQDPALQERLRELTALYEELADTELRERLEELRRSLDEMDPEAVQRALEELAAGQEEFRRNLERSLELMRRAAAEHQMNALARSAREIAQQEDALAEALEEDAVSEPSAPDRRATARAEQQHELADRTQELEQAMERLGERLGRLGEDRASASADSARTETRQAEELMRRAAETASDRRPDAASRTAAAAGEELAGAADRLEEARQGMASAWRNEVQAAVGQATRDALDMARRQESLRQELARGEQRGLSAERRQELQAEQAALQQGLEQLGRNLDDAARRSALVDRQVGAALGRALDRMEATQQGLQGAAGRDLPAGEASESVDALNRLAHALLRNSDRIAASGTGTGVEEALDQLAELAGEQGALNGRSGALAPMDLGARALARQLQELAAEQQSIADRLGGMAREGRDEGVTGDLAGLAEEADRLAEELAGGRLDAETLRRQERLFHRLLDAGRSLERDEPSERRTAERPAGTDPAVIPALDRRLLDSGLAFPPPDPEALRALPPAYRVLILEYFDRLNRGAEPPEARP